MTKPPQNFFVYKFRRPTSSTFQKALDDFCATFGFHFIDERVPKNSSFLAILVDKICESFFQSHLIYISIINMMQNCTYMFKTSLIFKKNKIKNVKKNYKYYLYAVEQCPAAWRGAAARVICALLVTDR